VHLPLCLLHVSAISKINIFPLISPSDIFNISLADSDTKIIIQCDVKHIITLQIETVTLSRVLSIVAIKLTVNVMLRIMSVSTFKTDIILFVQYNIRAFNIFKVYQYFTIYRLYISLKFEQFS
jgi:hypothetical protein